MISYNFTSVRSPLIVGLIIIAVIVGILSAEDYVKSYEKRAAIKESEVDRAKEIAGEIIGLRSALENMRGAVSGGEPVGRTVERICMEESIILVSSQSAGQKNIPPFRDVITSFRVKSVAHKPLINLLNKLESARTGLIVSQLTIRRSIEKRNKLDAEIIASQFEIQNERG